MKNKFLLKCFSFIVPLLLIPNIALALPPMILNLQKKAYDQSLSFDQRLAAVKELTGFPLDKKKVYKICVWDPIGKTGPMYSRVKDQRSLFLTLGIKADLIPYSNETVMVETLKSGSCDAALMTGFRAKIFNSFSGSLDAIGGILNLDDAKLMYRLLSDPRNASNMTQGDYTILGMFPNGTLYPMVNNREISNIEKMAGKRFTVLDFDPMMSEMVLALGGTPVPSDLANALKNFNTGAADITAAALILFDILELKKGIGTKGGILDYPLLFSSMQLIGHKESFPDPVAQLFRERFYNIFDLVREFIETEERKVPKELFIPINNEDQLRYQKLIQEMHIMLVKEKYYNEKMLYLLKKVRCRSDASRFECSEQQAVK